MGYLFDFVFCYFVFKKCVFIMVGIVFVIGGVVFGVVVLAIIMSVIGGFYEKFCEKVVGVNVHVLVLKYFMFCEYCVVMDCVVEVDGVVGVVFFSINFIIVWYLWNVEYFRMSIWVFILMIFLWNFL